MALIPATLEAKRGYHVHEARPGRLEKPYLRNKIQ
jgi:hypothetical protein